MTRPHLARMLVRGARRRCPWCGGRGGFFSSYFTKTPSCRTCSLQWRRGDVGFELGAAAMAAIITLGPLILALLGLVIITWPEIDVVLLFIVLGVGAVLLPFVMYPRAYLMWQAIDLVMRPVQPTDFVLDAEPDVATDPTNDVRRGDA
ncbi:MAG: hypothetical protein AAGA42_16405 [Actinomycetota bacterium]